MGRRNVIAEVLQLLSTAADRTVRWRLAAAIVLVTAGGLLAALSPLLLKEMIDAVSASFDGRRQPSPTALLLGAGYLLALCGGRMLGDFRGLLTDTAEQRMLARLTQRLFGHLLALPLQFHLGRKAGEFVHSIHMATTGSQLLTTHLVGSLLPVLVEVATVSVVLLHLEQPALLATFAATAVTYLVLFGIGSMKLSELAHNVSGASMEVNATLTDTLLNCEAVKCFVAEPAARSKLAGATDALESRWAQLYRLRMRLGLAVTATFTLSVGTALTLAADGVARGTLTVGGFVLANLYMLQIVRPLEVLGAAARDLSQAIGFIRPLLGVLDLPTETYEATRATITEAAPPERSKPGLARVVVGSRCTTSPSIRFEKVSFGYDPQRRVLNDLDLNIAAGRTLAIVGASGSGKSSVIRLLLRLYEPQSGRILLNGRSIDTLRTDEVRAIVGLVPQDTVLLNDTLGNNISLGKPGAHRTEIESAARRAQLHDLITSLPDGYDTMVGERGLKLSGGERQRVAISRVLLKAPRIFVFDEATSMLDSQTEAAILHDLQTIAIGCTTIMIAHRLSTVRHADEIAVLDKGEIKELGPHVELLARGGAYASLWHRQMHGTPA